MTTTRTNSSTSRLDNAKTARVSNELLVEELTGAIPPIDDLSAMIASAGRLRLEAGERDPWTLNADPGWQI